jgi:hypothetical protein
MIFVAIDTRNTGSRSQSRKVAVFPVFLIILCKPPGALSPKEFVPGHNREVARI